MKVFYIVIALFLMFFFNMGDTNAQITTSSITFNPICPGSVVPVTFNSPGTWLQSTENVTIELSNATGSFASGTTILHNANYASASWFIVWYPVSYSQTINVTIPLSTPAGTAYRIRTYSDYNTTPGDNGANLTINPTPVLAAPSSFTTSSASVCQGQSNVAYTVSPVAGASSYVWSYSGTGATFSGSGNAITANFSGSATTGTISVYSVNANGCISATALSMSVTVTSGTAPSRPGGISNPGTICQGTTGVAVSCGTSTGAAYYTWSYSGTGVTINGTTNNITLDFSSTATSGTLTVYGTNSCGTNSTQNRTRAITVNNLPAQPGAYTTSSVNVCQGQTNVAYTIPTVSGASSYTWSYTGTGATISGGTTRNITINFSASATSGVLRGAAINGCGTGTSRDLSITVNSIPSGTASNDGPACVGSTVNLSTSVSGATYAWSGPSGFSSAAQNPSLTYGITKAGLYSVLVTQNGCSATFNTTLSTNSNLGLWTGNTSSAWGTVNNWCGGVACISSTDVTIPSSAPNMPVISGSANCRNLTIAPSASLTNNGTLNIYGNAIGSAATSYVDNGTTAFVGSLPQIILGIDTLHDMTINNTTGVILSSPAYVKQYLTLTNGTLTSNGNLTVDIYFGAIKGAGNGAIAGNINVVRTIWKDRWHYVSSPLAGKTFADINDDVLIKFGANANLYEYDETVVDPDKEIGWTKINSTATPFQSMKGYALFFPRWIYKTEVDFTGTYDHNASYSNATLSNTPSSDPTADGWNLVGNPYPSEIDWDAASGWTKTGLDNAVYIYDSANNRYATYVAGLGVNGGSRYIPVMQAFYVKVTNPGTGTLAMNKNVRTTVVNRDNFRVANEQEDPIIRLKSSIDTYSDEAVIRINENATDGFDSQLDAFKMPSDGNTPSISSRAQNKDYVVNSLPAKQYKNSIPLRIVAANNGKHTITADITGFYPGEKVVLEDKLLGVTQDLIENPSYEADLVKGDTTTRFFINYSRTAKVEQTTATNNASENNQLDIFAYKQNVNVIFNQNAGNADIIVYDMTGNKVASLENVNTNAGKVEMAIPNAKTGIYIVKVMANNNITTKQVYISK